MHKRKLILCFCSLLLVLGTTAVFLSVHTYDNLLRRADDLAAQSKLHRAIPFYRSAHALQPQNPLPLLAEVRIYQQLGETKDLERLLRRVGKSWLFERILTKWAPDQKRELAWAFYDTKDLARAESIYENLWYETGDESDGLHLAEVLAGQENYTQAAYFLNSITKQYPKNRKAKELLADVFSWGQNFEDAIPLYRELIADEESDSPIHRKLANALEYAGHPEEAAPILESLSQERPDDRQILIELARTLGGGDQYPRALEILNRLEGGPLDEKAQVDEIRLFIWERHGFYEESERVYLEKLRLNPKDIALREKLLGVLEAQKKFGEALEYCVGILAEEPENESILRRAAYLASWMGRHEESAGYFEKLSLLGVADHKTRMELASAWLLSGQKEKAMLLYEKISKENPSDSEVADKLLEMYASVERNEEMLGRLKKLAAAHPGDDRFKKLLADMLSWDGRYSESLSMYRELSTQHPDDPDIALQYARILSWSKDYRQAETEYRRLIQKDPRWVVPRRELGRMMGWNREYARAVRQYEETVKAFPDDLALREELESKRNFYRSYDARAMKHYEKWILIEPTNLEAIFDLGQVYSRQGLWQKASGQYKEALRLHPSHFRAKQALNKVNIYAKETVLTPQFGFEEADGGSRLNDVRLYKGGAEVERPIHEGVSLRAGYREAEYTFSDFPRTGRHQTLLEVLLYGKPFWWGSLGYEYSDYSRGAGATHNFQERIHVAPRDELEFVLSHQKRDLIQNSRTLQNRLQTHDFTIRGIYHHSARLKAGADYLYGSTSDDNSTQRYGGDIKYDILDTPQRLTVQYRYEEYGYDQPAADYFSPSSFHTHSLLLEYRQYLNKEELFWGTNDTYYTVRYKIDLERNRLNGYEFYLDFHHDWNDRLSTHVEGSVKFYNRNEIYEEQRATTYMTLRF